MAPADDEDLELPDLEELARQLEELKAGCRRALEGLEIMRDWTANCEVAATAWRAVFQRLADGQTIPPGAIVQYLAKCDELYGQVAQARAVLDGLVGRPPTVM